MVGSGVVSGTKIAAGSGSMSVVCSDICSVQGVGGGWMGSGIISRYNKIHIGSRKGIT